MEETPQYFVVGGCFDVGCFGNDYCEAECLDSKPLRWLAQVEPAAYSKKHLGNLSVDKLPCFSWEKWCKDGVFCFGLTGPDVLKIYFGNPSDLSIYHVVDFVFSKFGYHPDTSMLNVCHALVGSKIYVLRGGPYPTPCNTGSVDVHYCDVANQSPDADGGYEWKDGPMLNSHVCNPSVFSLEGSIYVLSLGTCAPFKVLKPDSHEWESLDVPLTFSRWDECAKVIGSCICDDAKKILVYLQCLRGSNLSIYDIGLNRWIQAKFPFDEDNIPSCPGISESFIVDSGNPGLLSHLGLGIGPYPHLLGKNGEYPCFWHLLSLEGGKRFCLLAIYLNAAYDGRRRCYARFGTFDLVVECSSNASDESEEPDAKCLKLPGYTVVNENFKVINFGDGLLLTPSRHGSKASFVIAKS